MKILGLRLFCLVRRLIRMQMSKLIVEVSNKDNMHDQVFSNIKEILLEIRSSRQKSKKWFFAISTFEMFLKVVWS